MAVKINHKESHCSQGPAPEISSLLQLQHSGTFWIFFFIMKVKKMFQFAPPCSSFKVILYQTAPEWSSYVPECNFITFLLQNGPVMFQNVISLLFCSRKPSFNPVVILEQTGLFWIRVNCSGIIQLLQFLLQFFLPGNH